MDVSGLAVIGLVQPLGSIAPISELQVCNYLVVMIENNIELQMNLDYKKLR
jgi:hypothetical protein